MAYKAIALVGNDEAGKTTLAKYIKQLYNDRGLICEVGSFAGAVKDDLQTLGIDVYTKPYSRNIRSLVRSYAECAKEQFGSSYWARRYISSLNEYKIDLCNAVVVDDMRFHIELVTWTPEFTDYSIIVLTNNIPKYFDDDEALPQSVREVNEIISNAKDGKVLNSILVNNVRTPNGIALSVKQQIEEHLFGTLTNKASTNSQ